MASVTITLRPLGDGDLDALFRWESDRTAISMAAFTRPDPADRPAFDAHYRRVLAEPANWTRAIEQDGDVVGMIASFTMDGQRELTYWVDPSRWGSGIASHAVRLLLGEEVHRPLFARVAEHNLGSQRVLERNGFVKVGEETAWAGGVGRDVVEHIYRLD